MKPDAARRLVRAQKRQREAMGEQLAEFVRSGAAGDRIVPDLIPTVEDEVRASRAVRQLARQAERQPKGTAGRRRKVDELIPCLARLVFVERVMALDSLERAALTPAAMVSIARGVDEAALNARLRELAGLAPEIEVAS